MPTKKSRSEEDGSRRVIRWLEHHIRGRDQLFEPAGFETSVTLDRLNWDGEFTTEAIHESLGGPSVFCELVRGVVRLAGGPQCFVFYIVHHDNIVSEVRFVRPYRGPRAHSRDLRNFERQPADQGGSSFLGLLPSGFEWLLLSDYDQADRLNIVLYGPKTICGMVRSVTFVEVADWFISYIVKKHPDKETLRQRWMATDDPMAGRAGWSLTAGRVVKSPEGLDLSALLDRIESEMGDAVPEVQWTMNFVLGEIGIHFSDHRDRALDIGEKLGVYRDYPVSKGCTSPFAPIWINEMVSRQG